MQTSTPTSAPTSTQLYEAIYVSTIAPGVAISSVADIAGKSRIANQRHGITGLLIFDGMRYCQQLEGPQKQVLNLMEKIRHDPRHINVEIIHHGELASRRFKSFSLGYTTVEDPEVLERLENLDGQAAVNAFLALLSHVDYA
jgi:hypothetical protein